jgi:hypothetical protein
VHPDARTVRQLLTEDHYRVPAYQRNYAWGEEEIRQLIDDLLDAATDTSIDEYFLGNIVVSAAQGSAGDSYDVVDGQQRLTTLHLLFKYFQSLGNGISVHPLTFESRPRAVQTFNSLPGINDDDIDPGIAEGFRVISQYSKTKKLGEHIDYVLGKVLVVRLSLPNGTDLNRYFEVMNTRGEQLQQVDIVKARLMSHLPDTERSTFAWIWDACTRMDTYIQMALTPGNPELRERLFGPDWAWLKVRHFDDLLTVQMHREGPSGFGVVGGSITDAIGAYASARGSDDGETEEGERFSSVIEFPTFLLHVLRIVESGESEDDEAQLDDKKLVKRFQAWLEAPESRDRVREFATTLLQCRLLFDAFVIKREFTSRTGDDGIWSLKRLVKGSTGTRAMPRYVGSFPSDQTPTGETESTEDANDSKRVRLLEAALRVTYTSPRTMHWMTALLRAAFESEPSQFSASSALAVLQRFVRAKVAESFDSDGRLLPSGFQVPRILFTYTDFLLADQEGQLDFQFMFRNSIEHFYPQNPDDHIVSSYGELSDLVDRELFGNLALLTVKDNSKFTNSPPFMKAEHAHVCEQSPKLKRMANVALGSKTAWDSAAIHKHHDEMVRLLWEDICDPG